MMRYITYDLFEKVSQPNGELFEDEFNKQFQNYVDEFAKLAPRLPKRFYSEYTKKYFHDNIINSFYTYVDNRNQKIVYNVVVEVQDCWDENVKHILTFIDVSKINSNINFIDFSGRCDWIYSEILPVNKKYMSFEVQLFDDSFLYIEFKKLKYGKVKS